MTNKVYITVYLSTPVSQPSNFAMTGRSCEGRGSANFTALYTKYGANQNMQPMTQMYPINRSYKTGSGRRIRL